jgi:hypothetical protein
MVFGGSAGPLKANILHRRFQVPRLSFATAPLCALAAHNLKTGTVIWGCVPWRLLRLVVLECFGSHRIWINNNQGYNTNHVMGSFTVILYSTIFNIKTNNMEICG